MTAVMIDSNVLLDLATEDPLWYAWSAAAVESTADRFRLVINAIIYAEVAAGYSRMEDLDARLPKSTFEREPIPYEAVLRGSRFSSIVVEAVRGDRRCQIFLSAPMPRSPVINC